MKLALPIIICSFGFFFAGVGYLFRIMHWPMGTLIMAGGGLMLLTGVVVLVVMLNKNEGQNRD